ncbi:TPA: hypothetical protein N0F65_003084 [Lagenidium giganteum]|uniref:Allantoicase domain-containing protein n=1 Tax=Lagenidium giganteum TaxID=4803 RepID=A0AAV2YNI5_9STRA|nr:TPA: hypothetical protein N0F65_003084 [Lagenidium giganteum]
MTTHAIDAQADSLTNLASSAFGARVLFATDEWFAAAHNLLQPEEPVFIADKFTDFGKWMDGWESRRKRQPGHDWCIIELGLRGTIEALDIDTAFFTGNHAPRVSIQAMSLSSDKSTWPAALRALSDMAPSAERPMGRRATAEELRLAEQLRSHEWTELLPFTEMGAGYPETRHNFFRVQSQQPWTHLRVNMFPDGGIARVRVLGTVLMDWARVPETQLIDLVSSEHGGKVIKFNDAHYGHPKNLLAPGRSKTMADGWETARKKTRPPVLEANASTGLLQVPGKDWVVLKLGHPGVIQQVEVDTNHFKGNFPESCVVYGIAHTGSEAELIEDVDNTRLPWQTVLPRVKLQAHRQHYFSVEDGTVYAVAKPINYVKLEMFPDGGISRLRLMGFKRTSGSRL